MRPPLPAFLFPLIAISSAAPASAAPESPGAASLQKFFEAIARDPAARQAAMDPGRGVMLIEHWGDASCENPRADKNCDVRAAALLCKEEDAKLGAELESAWKQAEHLGYSCDPAQRSCRVNGMDNVPSYHVRVQPRGGDEYRLTAIYVIDEAAMTDGSIKKAHQWVKQQAKQLQKKRCKR
jgi:hypothetical protein